MDREEVGFKHAVAKDKDVCPVRTKTISKNQELKTRLQTFAQF